MPVFSGFSAFFHHPSAIEHLFYQHDEMGIRELEWKPFWCVFVVERTWWSVFALAREFFLEPIGKNVNDLFNYRILFLIK